MVKTQHKRAVGTLILLSLFLLFVFVYKETNKSKSQDITLFSAPSCQIVCWEEIKSAITTPGQLEQFLADTSDSVSSTKHGEYTLIIAKYRGPTSLAAVTTQNTLFTIELSGGFFLNLEQVIDKLGNPEYIHPIVTKQPNGKLSASATLYYPNTGYYFILPKIEYEQDSVCFNNNDLVSIIRIYYHEISIKDMIVNEDIPFIEATESNEGLNSNYVAHIQDSLKTWEGFRCISISKLNE